MKRCGPCRYYKPWEIASIGRCTNPALCYRRLWQRRYPITKSKSKLRTPTCYRARGQDQDERPRRRKGV
jgi:hypothetical protein